ncbi:MAG: phosphotransferase [Myxococcales bacterium]|nr:phosphotransferase [Myxococcales bacterium]
MPVGKSQGQALQQHAHGDAHAAWPPTGVVAQVARAFDCEVAGLVWGARLDAPLGQARVRRVHVGEYRRIVKGHIHAAGHLAEQRALNRLAPALRPWLPSLQASDDADRWLLMDDLPGISGQKLTDSAELVRMHQQAGQFVAALWRLPVATVDPMTPAQAIERRRASWLANAHLPTEATRLASDLIDPGCFAGATRVHAHRDFRPGNWLWGDDQLHVIDFGQYRVDLRWVDVVKLETGSWQKAPALRSAFYRGLGQEPTDTERAQLRGLCALHGLATCGWASRKGEPALVREGLTILRNLADNKHR